MARKKKAARARSGSKKENKQDALPLMTRTPNAPAGSASTTNPKKASSGQNHQSGKAPDQPPRPSLSSLTDEEALELLKTHKGVAEQYQRMCAERLQEYKTLVEKSYNERLAELEDYVRAWKQKVETHLANIRESNALTDPSGGLEKVLAEGNLASVCTKPASILPAVSSDWHTSVCPAPSPAPGAASVGDTVKAKAKAKHSSKQSLTDHELHDLEQHLHLKYTPSGESLRLTNVGCDGLRIVLLRSYNGANSFFSYLNSGSVPCKYAKAGSIVLRPTYENIRTIWSIHRQLKQRLAELTDLWTRHNNVEAGHITEPFADPIPALNAIFSEDSSSAELSILDLSSYFEGENRVKRVGPETVRSEREIERVIVLGRKRGDESEFRLLGSDEPVSMASANIKDNIVVWETWLNYRTMYSILHHLSKEDLASFGINGQPSNDIAPPKQSSKPASCDSAEDAGEQASQGDWNPKILRIVFDKPDGQKKTAQTAKGKPKSASQSKQKPRVDSTPAKENNDDYGATRSGTPFRRLTRRLMLCDQSNDSKENVQLGKRPLSPSTDKIELPPLKRSKIESMPEIVHLEPAMNNPEKLGSVASIGSDSDRFPAKPAVTGSIAVVEAKDDLTLLEKHLKLQLEAPPEARNSQSQRQQSVETMKEASDAIIREQIARNALNNSSNGWVTVKLPPAATPRVDHASPRPPQPQPQTTLAASASSTSSQGKLRDWRLDESMNNANVAVQRVADALQKSCATPKEKPKSEP